MTLPGLPIAKGDNFNARHQPKTTVTTDKLVKLYVYSTTETKNRGTRIKQKYKGSRVD